MSPGIERIPDELLEQILYYLTPKDTSTNVLRISKRFALVGNAPLLWRYHCRTQFRYWDSRHQITQKFAASAGDVDWKKLFFYRQDVDFQITMSLDGIITEQIKRIEKFELISQFGYDAKDTLLRHCRADEAVEDVLARRFYGNSVLDHIHRSKALEEWSKMEKGEDVPLERALGCFDMFLLHDDRGDISEISDLLDNLVVGIRASHAELETLPSRLRALTVVRFLRNENLTGIASDLQYNDLQNNYIGIALQDDEHPSLPLISVAIFCAVAQRVGLDARCCVFLNTVYAMVYPTDDKASIGPVMPCCTPNANISEPIYFDPFGSDVEVPAEHLRTQLIAYGVQSSDFTQFLKDATTRSIVLRTSRNILATVNRFGDHRGNKDTMDHLTVRHNGNPFADMEHAFYSTLWANLIFFNFSTSPEPIQHLQIIQMILERFERLYPMDAALVERYVCPLPGRAIATNQWSFLDTLRVVRAGDSMPKQIKTRDKSAPRKNVKYQVGQVFRHRRYGYSAVITGWDIECSMNSQWIKRNQVDTLSRGRHQSFYHALVDDANIRYVAEESIEIMEPLNPVSLMTLAGRFFKRWDGQSRRFLSNIRDEYPDD